MKEEVAILASILYCASSKKPSMKERNLCLLASRMAWKHITSSCWVCTTLSPLANVFDVSSCHFCCTFHVFIPTWLLPCLRCLTLPPPPYGLFCLFFTSPLQGTLVRSFWVFLTFTHCSKITYPLCKIMKTTRLWNMLGTCHFIVCPFCCPFRKFWLTLPESPPKFLICTLLGTMAYTQHVP